MMKAMIYTLTLVVLGAAAIFFFMRSIDAAIEIDDLKSQIHLQQEGIQFIQTVANDAFSSCKTSVEQFEVTAKKNGHAVVWQGENALVGPFRITKQGSCITKIEQVGLFYNASIPTTSP